MDAIVSKNIRRITADSLIELIQLSNTNSFVKFV